MTEAALPGHDIIVIGGSSGGLEALQEIVSGLPRDLAGAIFVVIHVPPQSKSMLPQILNRAGPIPADHPMDNEAIQLGRFMSPRRIFICY